MDEASGLEESNPSDSDGASQSGLTPSMAASSSLVQWVPAPGPAAFGSPLSSTTHVLWGHSASPAALQDKGEESLAGTFFLAPRCVIFP